ncbi:SURF1 family cytochrome oxidase biogenesis protein [Galbitalea soli]|uniref:SURF1 family cytochrome oxidase biogenesis protein n=1 Tax=Galbitalea soli TaxID=1268042 RepID=UPI0017ED8741|nr:cytochrome oxidase assembly protein ShyY1 [Galbitalea soli]
MARRPRWIGALLLALAIAGGFAALGQWQLGRAVATATVVTYPTETVTPLASLATPQSVVTDRVAGQMVSVTARRVPGDLYLVSNRVNYGKTGYWVVGHAVTGDGVSLAVAYGWAPTRAAATDAASALAGGAPSTLLIGRYMPTEPPDQADFEHGVRSVLSVAALVNEWRTVPTAVYGGYLVSKTPAPGLSAIYSPKPSNDVSLNWLNVFYSIEWVAFAGFAVYLWYRLVKDAWEREQDQLTEAAPVN